MTTRFTMQPLLRGVALAAICFTATSASAQWSVIPIHNDSDNGISVLKTYTHAVDFGGGATVVNGVPFAGGGPGFFPGGENNIPNPLDAPWQPQPAYVTGGTYDLNQDFIYGAVNAFVRLDNLVPGTEYETRFYNRNWDPQHPFDRTQSVGVDFTGDLLADDVTVFNADNPVAYIGGPDNVHPTILSYRFVAGAPSANFTFDQIGGGSFHLYALTNEIATPPPPADTRVPIATLYSTGLDDNHLPLPDGAVDTHYRMTSSADPNYPGPASYVVNQAWPISPAGPWMGNTASSKWIAPRAEQDQAFQNPAFGNFQGRYTMETSFDLSGYIASTAEIELHMWADNYVHDVILNGVSLGLTAPSHDGPGGQYYVINSGFVPGTNTLEFVWENFPDTLNPAGLRVDMFGRAELVPEPSSLVLAGFGLIGLAAARRRRK